MAKRPLNEKLLILAKAKNKTQAEIADDLGMQPSHINRYFNGGSDLMASNFVGILKVLGIDVEKLASEEIKVIAGITDSDIKDVNSSVIFLLNSLDEIGRQTMLKHLHWVAEKTSKKRIPEQVTSIIQKEISRI